jgi:hypothetical protein
MEWKLREGGRKGGREGGRERGREEALSGDGVPPEPCSLVGPFLLSFSFLLPYSYCFLPPSLLSSLSSSLHLPLPPFLPT